MVDKFPEFAALVHSSFQRIVNASNAFVADVDPDALYEAYLKAFPDGTNPIFVKRTEHDCSCCKQFIRRLGAVVGVWDEAATSAPYPYDVVAAALRDIVAAAPIADVFVVGQKELSFGAARTITTDMRRFNHLYSGEIPAARRAALPDTARGTYRTTVQVFRRGLTELTLDALDTTLSLIDSGSLYRGEEFRANIAKFRIWRSTPMTDAEIWRAAADPAVRFRNTAIGTLVQDLSEGVELEKAVRSYDAKVAPQNYKRTTALITPRMITSAMETIRGLGLESALERRFAHVGDVAVGDVKWVDGGVRPMMKGSMETALLAHATTTDDVDVDTAESITLDRLMTEVLPRASGVSLLLKNEHAGNLISITAPAHADAGSLFKWPNNFAWSYSNNVADSIKERVKQAGGQVEGNALRVSLAWQNLDDLDLHCYEPGADRPGWPGHIYFGARTGAVSGGTLDVDMNVSNPVRGAVENIRWARVKNGAYHIIVHNYFQRESSNPGFAVEVENAGKLQRFSYAKIVRGRTEIRVATLHLQDGRIQRVDPGDPGITSKAISREKWGLKTEKFVKVNMVMLSPNHWGSSAVGNKHTIFVLDGAVNDEATRGIYNEFLSGALEPHRKVFEVIGDKTKCQPVPADKQLSGLGFSSTKRDSFVVKVTTGKRQQLFNVNV